MAQQLPRTKVWANLLQEVVRTNLCVSCGTCAAVCPTNSIIMKEDQPNLVSVCIACGMCYNSCPRTNFSEAEAEEKIFGHQRPGNDGKYLGVYRSCCAARSKDEKVLSICQDGGTVTSITMQLMKEDSEVCTVAASVEEGTNWRPEPTVATSVEELLKCAGTKYTPSANILGLGSAVKEYKRERIALVGTPCQMRGWRRMNIPPFSATQLGEKVQLAVGLFCMESFDYKSLVEHLQKEGVDLSRATRFEISSGRFQVLEGKQVVYKAALKKMADFVRQCCRYCTDFAAEFADVSIGSVGSPEGWNTVIVRTERGEKALDNAVKAGVLEARPLERGEKSGLNAVTKLAKEKREKAEKMRMSEKKK